jgi:hypothetical protein
MTIREALFKVLSFNQRLLDISSLVPQSPELKDRGFIGVHLHGENDRPGNFGGIEDQNHQMRLYKCILKRLKQLN